MTTIDSQGNLHGATDGRFATKPRGAAAGSLDAAERTPEKPMVRAFASDLARLRAGQATHLGYLYIDRADGDDLVVVYPDAETARRALEEDPLIDSLCEEDALDAGMVESPTAGYVDRREVVLCNDDWASGEER